MSITVDLYNTKTEVIKKISLPKEIFGAKINNTLLVQAVRVYLSNQRLASAHAKTRGEVDASGKKIYNQKGTGRARHGDRKAPIFVKGGKAHGPTGTQNYKLKMSKTLKIQAVISALSSKLMDKEIIAIEGLENIEPKTKKMALIIKKFQPKADPATRRGKISLVLPESLDNIMRAGRNIENLNLLQANSLNTYEILNGGKLIFMKDSIDVLKKIYI